jgi:hypothetical protein
MRRAAVFLAIVTAGCVVASGRHPSRLEVARENGSDLAGGATGQCDSERRPPLPRPPRPAENAVWIDGQCHWDGVRYLWEPGHWATLR